MGHVSRWRKLRAMSLPELVERARYAGFIQIERQLHRRGRLTRPDRLRRGLRRELRQRDDWADVLLTRKGGGTFFASFADPARTRELLHTGYRPELDKARRMADTVAAGHIEFFGERFSYAGGIDWHTDPPSGRQWPRTYHADVPMNARTTYGDAKYVWELNRHQFLMDLAKVAFLDDSTRHQDVLEGMLLDWQRAVPYGTGAAWACALEPAFRAWSWIWAYHMVRARGRLEPSVHLAWLTGFYDHGRFIHRHLEYYSSPYNHLIGEACALFALGLLFPEFDEAEAWVRRARTVLESTVGAQFHPDGGTVEQSTFYHHATLGFYLLSALLGQRNGVELRPPVMTAVERALEFSMALMQPDGRLPSIGGADDGKPIRLEHLPFWDFRPYYAIGAVVFGRGDFKSAASRFWEDALWILGPDGAASFEALPAREPKAAWSLPASGYSVFRTDWSASADYLCFDCGPQAAGLRRDSVPSAAHGHADCLSVIAAFDGERVLVDPGFFCYNGEPQWEVHFRKTPAHNTISIDGLDQARHISKMVWTHTYAPQLESVSEDDAWASGRHDGFVQRAGVLHRRSVWLRPGGYLIILDDLSAAAGHVATATFQLAPGHLELREAAAIFNNRFALAWTSSVAVQASMSCGADGPAGGWVAPSLGIRVPAPRLSLEMPLNEDRVLLLTVLADGERSAGPAPGRVARVEAVSAPAHPVLAVRVNGPGWTDHVVASGGGYPVRCLGLQTDAPLAVIRVADDGSTEVRHAGGGHARLVEPVEPSGRAAS